ncbi:MAG TPA: methyltransferase domain-containing protein [Candidatus Binatia bacterium]|nr:methyltransferase domain-containing protein [Candidatus Binatia bacterium]
MDEQANDYWSRVARRYDDVADLQIGPATRGLVRERLAKEGWLGDVVELGCGSGFYTPVLAAHADRVLATDSSPGMVDLARERVASDRVRFQVEDCEKTSLPDGSFDTAFMALVIHFTDAARALAEMRRILKPGGTLILANLDFLALRGFDRVRCFARITYRGIIGYRTGPPPRGLSGVLDEERLRELLARSGFEVATVETFRDPARSSYIPVQYVKAVRAA